TRVWWPIALVAALASRRARRAVIAAALVPPLLDWVQRRPAIDPARYTAIRIADDVAYGSGVWQGVLTTRCAAPLRPTIS
ncbi:MAG TPA: hypothetical protein PLV68_18690, partial [Ilumatobacteraceae bacterium]|nr:hypothetical protein [Ilumatobacteraceae bacterium]